MPEPRERSPAAAADHAARLGPRLLLGKALVLVALALGGALLGRVPWIRAALGPAGQLTGHLTALGPLAIPVFLVASTLLIALGVPRLLFCPLAGAAFGFWGGLAVSTAATMAAYFASFLFLRGRLADRDEPFEFPPRLAFLRHDPGITGVILTRLLPVPGLLGTVALSLSPVGKRSFLAGSLVGLIPEAVPLILLGAGLLDSRPRHLAWLFAATILLILASFFLVRRLLRKYRLPAPPPP